MADQKPLRVVVVGAGVTGCLVTYGLQSLEGVEVVCVEKGAPENVLAGTGLNVGPNGLKILQETYPELARSLCQPEVSLPWRSWKAGLTDGTVLLDLSLAAIADTPGIRIRWSDLYRILRAPLLNCRYFTSVVEMGYDETATRSPLFLVLRDQNTGQQQRIDQVDLLLGCDGRYSQVRETFWGKPQPAHLGVCIYRLLVPNSAGLVNDYQQWFHNGHRLLTFAIPGNEVYIAGSFPLEQFTTLSRVEPVRVMPGVAAPDLEIPAFAKTVDYLSQCYRSSRGYSPTCEFLVHAICAHIDTIHWARLQDIPAVFGDRRGHVLCLGDSSHAMLPTLGQGATQAFEDGCAAAILIARAITTAQQHNQWVEVPKLVQQIENLRRDRIQFVQSFSREASDSLLVGSDPVRSLQNKNQPAFLEKLRRLYCNTPAL